MKTIISKPTSLIVSLADAREQCRIYDDQDDSLLSVYINAAAEIIETHTRRAYRDTTISLKTDDFTQILYPSNVYEIVDVKYYDLDNVEQTLATSVYYLKTMLCFQTLDLKFNQTFPDTYSRWDAVTIQYKAGFTNIDNVPAAIQQAALLIVDDFYNNRSAVQFSQSYANKAVEALLNTQRITL